MKYKILQKLKESGHCFVSGEFLSEQLNVSRTAIWKQIQELKKEGYKITSSSKKGYTLDSTSDILNIYEISSGLKTVFIGKNIRYFNTIDSTNNCAKKLASENCENGTIVVADSQTAGRGRYGRAWDSTRGKGIWMSVILRPAITLQEIQVITLAASVAIVSAIKKITGINAGIKWPNDIILEGKKVCGILTEINSEIEQVNSLILGIGLNVNQDINDFPDTLKNTAISLKAYLQQEIHGDGSRVSLGKGRYVIRENRPHVFPHVFLNRSKLINEILFELERAYNKVIDGYLMEIIDEWKMHSVTIGKEVRVTIKDKQYTGSATDITNDGKLIVNCDDGITREILSGEINVRGMLGFMQD